AIGLALYFLCAVAAHIRIKEPLKESLPAIFLFLIAAVTAALQLAR
ncbi:MAG: DoxX family protein, partial [Acidimicrobiia bacterium]|nr:DoxX family protein [Acidimicrobiia bacterium]